MISKLKDRFNNIDKKYLIGAAIIGVTAVGILVYFKTRKTPKPLDTPVLHTVPE